MKETISISALKQRIGDEKVSQVLEVLKAALPVIEDTHHENVLILLASRLEKLKRSRQMKNISAEHDSLEYNSIKVSLLEILDELEVSEIPVLANVNWEVDSSGPTVGYEPEPKPEPRFSWKQALTAIAGTIALLAGIAEFSGYSLRDLFTPKPKEPTTSTASLSTDSVPDSQPSPPETTKTTPPDDSRTMPEVAPQNQRLSLELRTNKGSKALVYQEGEEVQLFFKVNKPCQLRCIYRMADSSLILLSDDRPVKSSTETNTWVELGHGFDVAPPFGTEQLYLFAQEKAFPDLLTEKVGDYTIIKEQLSSALSKTRGLKQKRALVEQSLTITTTQSNLP